MLVFRIIVVMPNRKIRIVRMEDARVYITTGTPTYGDDIIMLDDVHRLELGADALHLSFMFFCFCQEGEAKFKINGRPREMHKHDLLFGFGEQVFEDCLVSDDFKGKMLLVSRKFSQESIVGLYHLWPYLMDVYHSPVIHLEEKEARNLHALTTEGLRRMEDKDNPFLSDTIISIMRIFYFDMCQILSQRKEGKMEVEKNSRLYAIFDEFMQLLSQNFKKERNVVWYGEQMCLSPKYLSEVVKEISGRSASGWISAMVINEIKTLLRNTNYSVKEVAQIMNFRNQSFLGKYFKNYTGMSPREYKKKE